MERRALVAVEVGTVTRLTVLAGLAVATKSSESFLTGGGDVARYAVYATGQPVPDLTTWFPWEYPALARTLMGLVPGSTPARYVVLFALSALLVDLAILVWLGLRTVGDVPATGVWLWALAVPLLGVLPYTRYDLFVAAAVMVALVLAVRRPVPAALLLSVAIGLKWWPLVVLPLVVAAAPRGRRGLTMIAGLAPWLVAEVAGIAVWGSGSVSEPVSWLASRGLQVEAPVALPRMWQAWRGAPGPGWHHNTPEFASVGWLPTVVGAAGAVAVLLVVAISVRRLLQQPADTSRLIVLSSASAVAVLVVTGRVLSPQYVVWVVGLLALLGTVTGTPLTRAWVIVTCTVSALTSLVFPFGFDSLVSGGTWPLVALTARDVLLVGLAVALLVAWWSELRQTSAVPFVAEPDRVDGTST